MRPFEKISYDQKADVDIYPEDDRFGEGGRFFQPWWERNVELGSFEIKVEEPVSVMWYKPDKYRFSAKIDVLEQTGVRWDEKFGFLFPLFRKRYVRMAEWQITGEGTCCDVELSDWKKVIF